MAVTLIPEDQLVVANPVDPVADRQRLFWALGIGIAGLIAALLWVTGVSAFPLVLVAVVAGGLGLAQFSSLRLGFLGALAVVLGGYSIVLQFTMAIPWGLAAIGGIALLALVLAGMAAVLREPAPVLPSNRAAIVGALLLGLAVLTTIVFIPWRTARGAGPVWAMHNDAVIQMIKALVQINAGGFDTSTALNPTPLPAALIAVAATVGRLGVDDPNRYLQNDALRLAELWGLLVLATSALSAWITWRMCQRFSPISDEAAGDGFIDDAAVENTALVPPVLTAVESDDTSVAGARIRRSVLPIIATVIGALLPFTWYFAGFAFAYGFLNSTLALVLLLLAWAIWLELPDVCPLLVAGLLSLVTVATLATWAPLALIPAGLTIWALIKGLRYNLDYPTRGRWLGWVLAALPVPLYGLFVTLPDFNQQGEDLAVEGGIASIPFYHVVLVGLFAAVAVVLAALVTRRFRLIGGIAAVLGTGAFVVGFLVHLNTRVGFPGWGYYPVKAAWTLTSMLLVIGLAALLAMVLHVGLPRLGQGVGIALACLVAVFLMRQYIWQPLSIRNFFSPVEVLHSSGFAAGPWRANILFDAYRDDQLTIVQLDDPAWMVQDQIVPGDGRADRFSNFWLLQVHPGAGLPGGPEIDTRGFAYTLNPRYPQDFCAAVQTWGRPTTVLTVDPTLEEQLLEICPAAPLTVELINPAWSGN